MAVAATAPLRAPAKLARRNRLFAGLLLLSTLVALTVLVVVIADLVIGGWSQLRPKLLFNYPSTLSARAGARSAVIGTLWLMGITAVLSVPVGISAAIYLEEFAPKNRLTRTIETNIANLAGVPSVVYGLLGLGIFVRTFQMERTILVGGITLGLLVLPVIIITAREAMRAVPTGIREGAFALGATQWEVVRTQVLPASVPGIMTGTILALSRAIGEAAPIAAIGVFTYAFDPLPNSRITALPTQILAWILDARTSFGPLAAAAGVLLILLLLGMNGVAIWLRNRYRREW